MTRIGWLTKPLPPPPPILSLPSVHRSPRTTLDVHPRTSQWPERRRRSSSERPRTVQLSKCPFSRDTSISLLSRIISLRNTDRHVSRASPWQIRNRDPSIIRVYLLEYTAHISTGKSFGRIVVTSISIDVVLVCRFQCNNVIRLSPSNDVTHSEPWDLGEFNYSMQLCREMDKLAIHFIRSILTKGAKVRCNNFS